MNWKAYPQPLRFSTPEHPGVINTKPLTTLSHFPSGIVFKIYFSKATYNGFPAVHPLLLLSSTPLDLRPCIPQCHGSVENQMFRRGLNIDTEIAQSFELVVLSHLCTAQQRLDAAVCQLFPRVRV